MERAIIEDIVVRELKGLCSTCFHFDSCAYSKRQPDKAVIQCEMFEIDKESGENPTEGLCRNCDLAKHCRLPGRRLGTWHCNEFQ